MKTDGPVGVRDHPGRLAVKLIDSSANQTIPDERGVAELAYEQFSELSHRPANVTEKLKMKLRDDIHVEGDVRIDFPDAMSWPFH